MNHVYHLLACAIIFSAPCFSADWLQQGGPNRDFVVPPSVAGDIAADYPTHDIPLLWKTSAGVGTAPVVVSDGKVYTIGLFTAGADPQRLGDPLSSPTLDEVAGHKNRIGFLEIPGTPDYARKFEGPAEEFYKGDEYAECLDAATGNIIWATRLSAFGIAYIENTTCGALASPAISDGKIIFHSPTGHLYCLDKNDGKKIWEVNLWDYQMCDWSDKKVNGCGPLIVNGTVMVSYAGYSDQRYQDEVVNKAAGRKEWSQPLVIVSGFALQDGKCLWTCKPTKGGFRCMDARIGYSLIENNPTVLVPFGAGTYGIDPANGKKRWEYDILDDKDIAHDRRGLWAPYCSYAPVAWKNFIIDDVSNAHDDIDSRTWCIQIINNQPRLVWETNQMVPCTECAKSNLVIHDGKIYGFDAHGNWDDPGLPSEKRWLNNDKAPHNEPGRNRRDSEILRFQCRDVETGKLLWSSDCVKYIDGHGQDAGEWYPTQSLMCGDLFITYSHAGLDILRLNGKGAEIIAKGPPDYYNVWKNFGFGAELVLTDGLLYVRKFASSADRSTVEPNLFCYDLRLKRQ